jgi:hypothetical protein
MKNSDENREKCYNIVQIKRINMNNLFVKYIHLFQ